MFKMKLATTTGDFSRFCKTYSEALECISVSGFKYIDLSMYSMSRNSDLLSSADWKCTADIIRQTSEKLGLSLIQSHAPGGNPLDDNTSDALAAATVRAVEVCGYLGIPCTVVHAGWKKGISKDEYFELNRGFYRKLIPAMEKYGVKVLVENSTKANMGECYYLITGTEMREFVDYVDHPLFGACWDTGHANVEGGQYEHIMAMGDVLCALHINDNRGKGDEHIVPYLGTLNLDDIMCGLIDSDYKGYFTFECDSSLRPANYWQGNRHKFERSTLLSEPTLEIQMPVERLMYQVGVHALKVYGCFEE